jgi:uncharacterized protein
MGDSMRTHFAVLAFTFVLSTSCLAQAPADDSNQQKQMDIKKLMELTGTARIGVQLMEAIIQNMTQVLKQQHSEGSDKVLAVIKNELLSIFQDKLGAPGGLTDQMIPLYSKYFTSAEIKELLTFYQSDTGKKIIEVLPKVTAEAMIIGQKWGQGLGPEIMQRIQDALKKEGIEMPFK